MAGHTTADESLLSRRQYAHTQTLASRNGEIGDLMLVVVVSMTSL